MHVNSTALALAGLGAFMARDFRRTTNGAAWLPPTLIQRKPQHVCSADSRRAISPSEPLSCPGISGEGMLCDLGQTDPSSRSLCTVNTMTMGSVDTNRTQQACFCSIDHLKSWLSHLPPDIPNYDIEWTTTRDWHLRSSRNNQPNDQ